MEIMTHLRDRICHVSIRGLKREGFVNFFGKFDSAVCAFVYVVNFSYLICNKGGSGRLFEQQK